MSRPVCVFLFAFAAAGLLSADDVVFHSNVSLVRVDAQVVDRDNRTITGLGAGDFVLLEEGKPQPIRNFASENMPVDVLLLLDVSTSMRPHVERIASAAHAALRVLGDNDRVAIMVFDRSTRLRLPFRNSRQDVEREFERLLRQESFNGGTDITRGLIDAANYVGKEARPDARRAIVIVTDDQTERNRDEAAVERALTKADAVLCALIAPDAMRGGYGYPGTGRVPQGGGQWPGGGPTLGGPLGGIIFGRRGGWGRPGGPYPGGGPVGIPHTQSAGTAEIARESGGDSLPVDDASALETTLSRIRQRYALGFYLPPGVQPGQERNVEVELAQAARQRYPDAEVRYRRVYMADAAASVPPPVAGAGQAQAPAEPAASESQPSLKRRPAVNEPVGSDAAGPGWRTADEPAQPPAASQAPTTTPDPPPAPHGWRRVTPGDQFRD